MSASASALTQMGIDLPSHGDNFLRLVTPRIASCSAPYLYP
jgi:hypothetical protein